MFGLTKREQRWAAEQKVAEVIIPAITEIVVERLKMDTNERIAALGTEQQLHQAWRKRAEEAEARLAVYNTNGFVDADALAAHFITLEAELAKVKAECKEWEEAYYNQVGIREDELKPKIARLEGDVVRMSDNGASLGMHHLLEENKRLKQDLKEVQERIELIGENRYGRFISHGEYDALHIENTALRAELEKRVPLTIANDAINAAVADSHAARFITLQAAIEALKAERDAVVADKEYAIRMFDQKEAACLKALEERDAAVARLRYLYDDLMSKLIWHDKPPISFEKYAFNIDAAIDAALGEG